MSYIAAFVRDGLVAVDDTCIARNNATHSHQRQKINMDLVVLRTATSSLLSYSVVPEVGAEVSTQEPTMRVQEELGLVVQFG